MQYLLLVYSNESEMAGMDQVTLSKYAQEYIIVGSRKEPKRSLPRS